MAHDHNATDPRTGEIERVLDALDEAAGVTTELEDAAQTAAPDPAPQSRQMQLGFDPATLAKLRELLPDRDAVRRPREVDPSNLRHPGGHGPVYGTFPPSGPSGVAPGAAVPELDLRMLTTATAAGVTMSQVRSVADAAVALRQVLDGLRYGAAGWVDDPAGRQAMLVHPGSGLQLEYGTAHAEVWVRLWPAGVRRNGDEPLMRRRVNLSGVNAPWRLSELVEQLNRLAILGENATGEFGRLIGWVPEQADPAEPVELEFAAAEVPADPFDDDELPLPAMLPTRKYDGDAGFDLFVHESVGIPPRSMANVPAGVKVKLPEGVWAQITGRSSTIARGLLVPPSIIDTGWRGPLHAVVWNLTDRTVELARGERVAQLVPHMHTTPRFRAVWGTVEPESADGRNESGFGSTGK